MSGFHLANSSPKRSASTKTVRVINTGGMHCRAMEIFRKDSVTTKSTALSSLPPSAAAFNPTRDPRLTGVSALEPTHAGTLAQQGSPDGVTNFPEAPRGISVQLPIDGDDFAARRQLLRMEFAPGDGIESAERNLTSCVRTVVGNLKYAFLTVSTLLNVVTGLILSTLFMKRCSSSPNSPILYDRKSVTSMFRHV